MKNKPRSSRSGRRKRHCYRARTGRVLIECIVAMFLLAIVVLSSAVGAHDSLALADDALLVSRGEALAVSRAEDALLAPCTTSAGGSDHHARIDVAWQSLGSTASNRTRIDLTLSRSPLVRNALPTVTATLNGGGICP